MHSIVALPVAAAPVGAFTVGRLMSGSRPPNVQPPLIADRRRRSEDQDERTAAVMTDDSMNPRYEKGEMVIFNKSLAPAVGDHVVIALQNGGGVYIRRLVSFQGDRLRLQTYAPRAEHELAIDDVAEIYPCVGYECTVRV